MTDAPRPLAAVDPQVYEDWAKLAPWEVFKSDLELTLHHVLTEPTCPTARISFELPDRAGTTHVATASGDTVEEAIARVVEKAREVLPGLTEKRRKEVAIMKAAWTAQRAADEGSP